MIEGSTLSQTLDALQRRGFVATFTVADRALRVRGSDKTFRPEQLTIREHHRFEGVSDPDDMAIVYAVEGPDGTRGVLIDAFGVYAAPAVGAVLDRMRMEMPASRAMAEADGSFVTGPVKLAEAALFTDLYELTMAASYFREGMHAPATFSLFVRKLPARSQFLDFSTREARRLDCEEEVRLNRRLASDIYVGVVPLTWDQVEGLQLEDTGRPVEWLVKMREAYSSIRDAASDCPRGSRVRPSPPAQEEAFVGGHVCS